MEIEGLVEDRFHLFGRGQLMARTRQQAKQRVLEIDSLEDRLCLSSSQIILAFFAEDGTHAESFVPLNRPVQALARMFIPGSPTATGHITSTGGLDISLSDGQTQTVNYTPPEYMDDFTFAAPTGVGAHASLTLTAPDDVQLVAPIFEVNVNEPFGLISRSINPFVDFNSLNWIDRFAVGTVTLSLQDNGTGATLASASGSPLTKSWVNGETSFADLTIDKPGRVIIRGTSDDGVVGGFDLNVIDSCSRAGFARDCVGPLVWSGAGDKLHWSDADNWDQHRAPQDGDSLLFPAMKPRKTFNDLDNLSLNTIHLSSPGYRMGGNPLTLTGGITDDAGNTTYAIDTTLEGDPTIAVEANKLTVTSELRGTGSLTVMGKGQVDLQHVGTYQGGTTLKGNGTILIHSGDPFGPGDLKLKTGTIVVQNSSKDYWQFTHPVQLVGSVVHFEGGKLALTGTLQVPANSTAIVDNSLTLTGSLSGPGELTFDGTRGEVLLAGLHGDGNIKLAGGRVHADFDSPTYEGKLTLAGGTLILGSPEIEGTLANPLGIGALELNGGELIRGTEGAVTLSNPITLNGKVAIDTGGFSHGPNQNLTLNGNVQVTGDSSLTLAGKAELKFASGHTISGPGMLKIQQGSCRLALLGTIAGHLQFLQETGIVLAGTLAAGAKVDIGPKSEVTIDDIAVTHALVNGSGAINVQGGQLIARDGHPNYQGQVTMTSGRIDLVDPGDLGTGTLDLGGGLFSTTSAVSLVNPLVLTASRTVFKTKGPLTFTGSVTLTGTSIVGLKKKSMLSFSGTFQSNGMAAFNGQGTVKVRAPIPPQVTVGPGVTLTTL